MSGTLDIIVPVYRGEAETRACLASVLACRNARPTELVVIDDAGPEPSLRAWLHALRAEGRITLLIHPENRGFVASANEGMRLHPDRDVVLLNSDTEVAGDWIDRLARHAERDAGVGTVTPFSGNATICSYPRTLEANPLPESETTATLDAAFASTNRGRSVQLPTAVGFCMFIARRCLASVGAFDEARYGRGYGEEVDFCMRASRAGFRHLLAGDVYVRHIGEVSFGGGGADRRVRAQTMVDALYPEFQERLRAFLASDPPRTLRRRVDLQRLRASPKPREIFVVPAEPTPPEAVRDVAVQTSRDCEPLLLEPGASGTTMLRWLRPGEEMALFAPGGAASRPLLRILREIGISRVVLPDSMPLAGAVEGLAQRLGCARIGLHDRAAASSPERPPSPGGHSAWPELREEWLDPSLAPPSLLRRMARRLRGA